MIDAAAGIEAFAADCPQAADLPRSAMPQETRPHKPTRRSVVNTHHGTENAERFLRLGTSAADAVYRNDMVGWALP
jgi:hypothetical protein